MQSVHLSSIPTYFKFMRELESYIIPVSIVKMTLFINKPIIVTLHEMSVLKLEPEKKNHNHVHVIAIFKVPVGTPVAFGLTIHV